MKRTGLLRTCVLALGLELVLALGVALALGFLGGSLAWKLVATTVALVFVWWVLG